MELNWDDLMSGADRLEQMERLDAVVIDVQSEGVSLRVYGDGNEEIIYLPAYPAQFARLLLFAETLLNAEFGIQDKQLCQFRLN